MGQGPDLDGSVLIAGTGIDNRGVTSDLLDQRYSLGLYQELTTYLSLRAGYQHRDLGTRFENGEDFTRRSRQPRLELLYNRPGLTGRLAVFEQSIDSSAQAQSFERKSLTSSLNWRPSRGPSINLSYRDDTNVADVSVLGAGAHTRSLELSASYGRDDWNATYRFERLSVDSAANALRDVQGRHELRGSLSRSVGSDRYSLGLSGRASRLERTTEVGEGGDFAEPLPAVAGLFRIDTSPELGELESNPTLIDGDIRTPASPPIDIGGASTFRNIGVDLGVTRPTSRLEIAVDTISGPEVVWQVFRSRDNLIWEAIPGVTARFDEFLLRYIIRFPKTEDRFFKALNVSVNPGSVVLVTEVRALVDLDAGDIAGQDARESNLYRADAVFAFQPHERVAGSASVGLSNDQALTAGLVRRDFRELHAIGRVTVDIARDLDLNLGYRFNDSENLAGTVLLRTVHQLSAGLDWRPLPTLEAVLAFGRHRESEEGEPLQSLESVRLGVVTELLPDLRLVSDVNRSRLTDPFAGRDRITWTWSETLEMQPLRNWRVQGAFIFSSNETPSGDALLRRRQYRLSTTWSATAYLSIGGDWWITDDQGRRSLSQSFRVSYAPGDRLRVSGSYQGLEEMDGRGTFSDSLSLNYRLFARFLLFANLSRSRTGESTAAEVKISNLRLGLRLSF